MSKASTFLGGAKGRLLAPAIPFRFFAMAVLFQGLAWLALLWAAPSVPRFTGGLGWPLAAVHLVTLGVLVMTAIGASLQLLPVASRQAVPSARWPYGLLWSLFTAGVLCLCSGMAAASPAPLAMGAAGLSVALLLYLLLLAKNLLGARGMPLVIAHAWVACLCLLLLLGTGMSLALSYSGYGLIERQSAIALHVSFAADGFMGMLVMGFSHILVPMFALSENPTARWSTLALALAAAALLLALFVFLGALPPQLLDLALGFGALAFAIHVAQMLQALRRGMRQGLGQPFVLVRLGWGFLGASLLAALARDAPWLRAQPTLFGVLLLGGLLTLLLGVLSRIVPFLASMHSGAGMRRPPTPSQLTAQRPLAIHFHCHVAAMALLLAAVLADNVWLVRASAVAGLAGALAFAAFFFTAWRRMTPMDAKGPAAERTTAENLRPPA
jgi:hypothetical protein